ncbi:protein FAF-like, chloroplastic [Solanum tuberosum]|uniref:FAF domain-containing protein n=1 Tax=Solanum tuberosum TaxID=4113 RepID=M1B081_SOLTU|nr:PREDICTED: protein FAF-like, chloroplastic [Solanum tuberosum]
MATPQLSKSPTPLLPKTKGIVSILGSDTQRGKSNATSIRRTFSADMSSKQWLTQNGFFSSIKKIASSKDLALSTSSEEEEEEEEEFKRRKTSFDVWSSILSQKKNDDLQIPYIHPHVKRSTSSLSEKSLEICTENLGSENGSDGFSSYTPSENGDVDEEKHDHYHHHHHHHQYCSRFIEELRVVKYNNSKRSSSSYPPPITSLARGDNKPSIQMQSRRQDGRLILEAVSIPPQNHFHAHRLDGRLLLTLVDNSTSTSSLEQEMEDYGEEFDHIFDDIDDHTPQLIKEQKPKLSSGVINMKTSALMMNLLDSQVEIREKSIQFPMETKFTKFSSELKDHLGLGNKNLVTWSHKFNKVVNLTDTVDSTDLIKEISQITSVPQSLPTQLTPATVTSFNAYEYFWRKNPTIAKECNNYTTMQVVVTSNSITPNAKSTTKVAAYMNYLVPLQRGCKEPKMSLLIWEPYCIVTS